jgi:hypothetical protein
MTTRHYLPTLFGNTQLDEQWNNKVRSMMNNYWNEIIKEEQKRIIIKRTVGMGDVIQTEPIIRYYKNLGFEVWYVTSDSRGCSDILKYFKSTPDKILKIPENRLLEDILGYNNLQKLLTENGYDPLNTEFDIRLDLDLAYESRNDTPFVNAYFQTIGLKQDEIENMNLKPEFEKYFENTPVGGEDYFAVNLSGSGWGGKEIGVEDAKHILEQLKLKNKKLYHTSSIPEKYKSLEYLFDKINKEDDFNEMINIIKHSNGFVGADNGTMHAAIGFNKKIMIWNGAALTKITTHYDNKIVIAKEALGCLGCKHKIFYEIVPISPTQQTITFVPNCRNNIAFECMNGFDKSYLEMQIEDFINLNKII